MGNKGSILEIDPLVDPLVRVGAAAIEDVARGLVALVEAIHLAVGLRGPGLRLVARVEVLQIGVCQSLTITITDQLKGGDALIGVRHLGNGVQSVRREDIDELVIGDEVGLDAVRVRIQHHAIASSLASHAVAQAASPARLVCT